MSANQVRPGEKSFFDYAGAAVTDGLHRRCPRCHEGPLFRSWFHLRERCPRCGLIFAPEPGDFGAMLVPAVWIPYLVLAFGLFTLEMAVHPSHLVHGILTLAYVGLLYPLMYPFLVGGTVGLLYAMRRMR